MGERGPRAKILKNARITQFIKMGLIPRRPRFNGLDALEAQIDQNRPNLKLTIFEHSKLKD